MFRSGVDLAAVDAFGETPAHKAARAQHVRTVHGLQRMAADFSAGNAEEDTADDLLADKSRHWEGGGEGGGESLRSLRDLAKMRRDGQVNQSDFRRLKQAAIDRGAV